MTVRRGAAAELSFLGAHGRAETHVNATDMIAFSVGHRPSKRFIHRLTRLPGQRLAGNLRVSGRACRGSGSRQRAFDCSVGAVDFRTVPSLRDRPLAVGANILPRNSGPKSTPFHALKSAKGRSPIGNEGRVGPNSNFAYESDPRNSAPSRPPAAPSAAAVPRVPAVDFAPVSPPCR